jgi:group I intron endonuclease
MSLRALSRVRARENNPMFGLTHSEKTRALMAARKKGKLLSEETKAKISTLLSGDKHPLFGKERSNETKEKIRLARKNRHELVVLDLETNSRTVYPSVRAAARDLGISSSTIDGYFRNTPLRAENKPCKGIYVFSKLLKEVKML